MAGQIYPVVEIGAPELLTRFELLQAAPRLTGRVQGGVTLQYPIPDALVTAVATNCAAEHSGRTASDGPLASVAFESFLVWSALQCSVIGGTDLTNDEIGQATVEGLRRWADYTFATELFTGARIPNSDNLNDLATVVTNTAGGLGGAIAAVSRAYADDWGSAKGMVHIPTTAFDAYADVSTPYPLETARGHRVVSGTGYESSQMVPTTGGSAGDWVYITPTIYVFMSDPALIGEPTIVGVTEDDSRDIMERIAQAYGVVAYVPHGIYASKVA